MKELKELNDALVRRLDDKILEKRIEHNLKDFVMDLMENLGEDSELLGVDKEEIEFILSLAKDYRWVTLLELLVWSAKRLGARFGDQWSDTDRAISFVEDLFKPILLNGYRPEGYKAGDWREIENHILRR